MIESLRAMRSFLTWLMLTIIAASLGAGLFMFLWMLVVQRFSVFDAFARVGSTVMTLPMVVILVVLVLSCIYIKPRTASALFLARFSAVVIVLGSLFTLACSLVGLAANTMWFALVLDLIGGLADFVLKMAMAVALWTIARAVSAGRMSPAPLAEPEEAAEDLVPADQKPETTAFEESGGGAAPVFSPEEAEGAEWISASAAAAGTAGITTAADDDTGSWRSSR